MNDDEKFFTQFLEEPQAQFAAALYKRINSPMNKRKKQISLRQVALSFAAVCMLLVGALLIYPPTRAQALSLIRQIGAFTVTTEPPVGPQPTAISPDLAERSLTAQTASDASQLVGFAVFTPQNLPEGYVQAGPWSIMPNGNGMTVVSTYIDPAQNTFILINQYQFQAGDAFTDNVTGQETVRDVEVRDYQGVWITGRMMSSPAAEQTSENRLRSTNWLRWEENGIVYLVVSDGLTFDEVLQLAQSLK